MTEAELVEARRVRQEEWEKVRKPDQPEGRLQHGHKHVGHSSKAILSPLLQRLPRCPTTVARCLKG